jgi:hypothetical protein
VLGGLLVEETRPVRKQHNNEGGHDIPSNDGEGAWRGASAERVNVAGADRTWRDYCVCRSHPCAVGIHRNQHKAARMYLPTFSHFTHSHSPFKASQVTQKRVAIRF